MGRGPMLALGAALALSLALNARSFLTRDPPQGKPRPCPTAEAVAVTAPLPARASPDERLERCEQRSWELVLRTIAEDHARDRAARPRGDPGAAPVAQAEALCDKAKTSLREGWERDSDKIVAGLGKSLLDRAEQEKNLTRELAAMRLSAGLGDAEMSELEGPYRTARRARIAAASAALERQPPDLGAVLAEARGLFADEDALLRKVAGEPGAQAWRGAQLESRTVILALLATLARQEWDDSIRW